MDAGAFPHSWNEGASFNVGEEKLHRFAMCWDCMNLERCCHVLFWTWVRLGHFPQHCSDGGVHSALPGRRWTRAPLKVPIEESESRNAALTNPIDEKSQRTPPVTKRPGIYARRVRKADSIFLVPLQLASPCRPMSPARQLPISRFGAQINRAIPKGKSGPNGLAPSRWVGHSPKPATPP